MNGAGGNHKTDKGGEDHQRHDAGFQQGKKIARGAHTTFVQDAPVELLLADRSVGH